MASVPGCDGTRRALLPETHHPVQPRGKQRTDPRGARFSNAKASSRCQICCTSLTRNGGAGGVRGDAVLTGARRSTSWKGPEGAQGRLPWRAHPRAPVSAGPPGVPVSHWPAPWAGADAEGHGPQPQRQPETDGPTWAPSGYTGELADACTYGTRMYHPLILRGPAAPCSAAICSQEKFSASKHSLLLSP